MSSAFKSFHQPSSYASTIIVFEIGIKLVVLGEGAGGVIALSVFIIVGFFFLSNDSENNQCFLQKTDWRN